MKIRTLLSAASFLTSALAASAAEFSQAQACALIQDDAARLHCFDRVHGSVALRSKVRLDEPMTDQRVEVNYAKPMAAAAWSDNLFVRATAEVGKENTDAAEFALTRTKGTTNGSAKMAVIYVHQGTLNLYDYLDSKRSSTGYFGLGIQHDKTDPDSPVVKQDLRGGLWKVWNGRKEDEGGSALVSDFAGRLSST